MKHFFLFFILLTAITLSGSDLLPAVRLDNYSSQTQMDSVLVSINGEPVTLLDVLLETTGAERELAGMFTGERLFKETKRVRMQTMENIVLRKLVYLKYKENPFPVPPQDIENQIDLMAMEMGDSTRETLEKKITALGLTMPQLKERIKERIVTDAILSQLCDREVFITPKEVYEEYEKNASRWTAPAAYNLQLLQILRSGGHGGSDPEGFANGLKPLMKDISYDAFEELVHRHSDAPNAASGGKTGYITITELRPEFLEVLKDKVAGETVGPVKTQEAIYFIRICGFHSAQKIPFSKVSERLEHEMRMNALKENRIRYEKKLREKAVIRYYCK